MKPIRNGKLAEKSLDQPSREKMLDKILRRVQRHIIMSDDEAIAVTLWIAHTHCYHVFRVSPRLGITSPERGCGKSTLLHLLSYLVQSGLVTAHATPAAVFREINASKRTLLFDEADSSFDAAELIAILNTGHQRESAVVLRARSGEDTTRYSTWAPAAFAALNQIPDTLASRSITVDLRRKGPGQKCRPIDDAAVKRLKKLKRKLRRWCQAIESKLESAEPELPIELQNCAADNWLPLVAIAESAGGEWPQLARRAAKSLTGKEQPAIGTQLLSDISDIFASGADKIFSFELAAKLATLEGKPWPNFEGHGSINAASIAKLLAPYGITPKNMRDGSRVLRGYRRKQFSDAFARYLRPKTAGTS